MHVTLVAGFGSDVASAGGTRSYVESLSRYLERSGIAHMMITAGHDLRISENRCTLPVKRYGSTSRWLASLVTNLRSVSIPEDSIVHVQRPDDVVPIILSGFRGARVCTLHGNPRAAMKESHNSAVFAGYVAMEHSVLPLVDSLIFVDSGAEREYLRWYPWLEGRCATIPNAVDASVFKPSNKTAAKLRWGLSGPVFLYVGRLEPEKRVPEIVRAFREMADGRCTLVIAGDGSEREIVQEEATGSNVVFLGAVRRSDMPSLLNAADAVVLFSRREGLPSAALEALACGTPVLATPVGAIPGLVRDGENGRLVFSRADLVDSMNAIASERLPLAASISDSVRQYSWVSLGPRLVEVYARALKIATRC